MKLPFTPLILCAALAMTCNAPAATGKAKLGDADFPKPSPSARHDQKVKEVAAGEYGLVLIGDSITHTLQNFGGKYAPMTKRVWEKYYAPHRAINLGYSGYRTENILWHLQNGELKFKTSPKLFMVFIGTNNADKTNFKLMHKPEEIRDGVRAIVAEIRKAHPTSKILLLRPLPKGLHAQRDEATSPPIFSFSKEEADTAKRAGELIAKLADDKTVFSLDVGAVFQRPDGTIKPELMWDLLHPSPDGAEAMAKVVEPVVAKLMGEKSVTE